MSVEEMNAHDAIIAQNTIAVASDVNLKYFSAKFDRVKRFPLLQLKGSMFSAILTTVETNIFHVQ